MIQVNTFDLINNFNFNNIKVIKRHIHGEVFYDCCDFCTKCPIFLTESEKGGILMFYILDLKER